MIMNLDTSYRDHESARLKPARSKNATCEYYPHGRQKPPDIHIIEDEAESEQNLIAQAIVIAQASQAYWSIPEILAQRVQYKPKGYHLKDLIREDHLSRLKESIYTGIYQVSRVDERTPEHPVINDLKQLLAEKSEWEEEGYALVEDSVKYALKFVENSIIPSKLPSPSIEVHPDGEAAFTWRNGNTGIFSIAFDKDGVAAWAAYLETTLDGGKKDSRIVKGHFNVDNAISNTEKDLIFQIADV